jgi:hypothetical protein
MGLLSVGVSSTAVAQSAACNGNGKISKHIAKSMSAAQDAMKAKKWQESLSKIKEAEGTPGPAQTQYDKYVASEFRSYIYSSTRQDADAAREIEFGLNSPCAAGDAKAKKLKNLVGLYTQMKNYPKAIEFGNQALKISRDAEVQVAVAQAYYLSGNNAESARVMNELLERGGVPKEQHLLLVRAACEKANNNTCVSKVFEKLVVNYPKPDYWLNLMQALRKDNNDIQQLNVMRLSNQIKVMKKPDEYKEMAQLALDENLAGEAQAILEEAFAKNIFVEKRDIEVNTRLLNSAKQKAQVEKQSLAKAEADAKAAPTGDADVKVGAQYLAFGDAAKAVEAISRGIKKGVGKGDKNEAQRADEATILLGIAQLKANNKAAAVQAFKAAKRDEKMALIGKLWALDAA